MVYVRFLLVYNTIIMLKNDTLIIKSDKYFSIMQLGSGLINCCQHSILSFYSIFFRIHRLQK